MRNATMRNATRDMDSGGDSTAAKTTAKPLENQHRKGLPPPTDLTKAEKNSTARQPKKATS